MIWKSSLACLLILGAIKAEQQVQEEVVVSDVASASNLISLASEQMSQRPACLCPAGQTLVSPRHSSFLPPYCTTILRDDAVQCKLGWVGVCISDHIDQRGSCEFPEVLEMSCAGYGFDSQLIFHEGQFRCLLTGKTPKQCGDVCPTGYSPRCIQLRCLKAHQAEPIEIIIEVPVTVTNSASATVTATTTTTTIASGASSTTTTTATTTATTTTTASGSATLTLTVTQTVTVTKKPCHCHMHPCRCHDKCPHCGKHPCQCGFFCSQCGKNPCQCNSQPVGPFAVNSSGGNGSSSNAPYTPSQPSSNVPFKSDPHHIQNHQHGRQGAGLAQRDGESRRNRWKVQCTPWPFNQILGDN